MSNRKGVLMRRKNTVISQNVHTGSVPHSGPNAGNESFHGHGKWPSNRHHRWRGVALIWTAFFIMVMILLFGLMFDEGKIALNVHHLQNAADAAALAGAMYVKTLTPEATRQKTHDMGLNNTTEHLPVMLRWSESQPQPVDFPITVEGAYDYSGYDIIVGRWVRYYPKFVPTLDAPNAVKVIARRCTSLAEEGAPALRLNWGPMVGVHTADARRVAVAFCNSSNGAGLIVLSDPQPNDQTLEIGANAIVDIDNGGIHVNSSAIGQNNNDGAWIHGTPVIDAGFLNVVGGVTPPPTDSDWEAIFADAIAAGETGEYPVLDHSDGVQYINDPLAANMLGLLPQVLPEPYVVPYGEEQIETGPGARLDLPALIVGEPPEIPTWHAHWNGSSYDLVDNPTDPSVYKQWNGSTYESVEVPTDYDPGLFQDTVGLGTQKVAVTNPETGETTYNYTKLNPNVTVTLPPGYYPYGMRLTTGDDVTLAPSASSGGDTFFIWGGGAGGTDVGLYMSAGSLTGKGVTCYVTQNFATGVPGVLRITGGHLELESPGDYTNRLNEENGGSFNLALVEGLNGIAIWQDPSMTPLPEAHLNGNGNFFIGGTIYCPAPIHMRLEGDLGDTGNQILCGSANILGTAEITVDYDGRNAGNAPSSICIVY
jgi:hypothetical protein